MFYLEKCAKEGCKRRGSVALKEGDKYCNIHKEEKKGKGEEGKDE